MVSCDKVHYRASRVLCFIPETVRSLFVPPQTDDLQSRGDLVYEWGQAVLHMPQLLRRLAFKTRTAEEELQEVSAPAGACPRLD